MLACGAVCEGWASEPKKQPSAGFPKLVFDNARPMQLMGTGSIYQLFEKKKDNDKEDIIAQTILIPRDGWADPGEMDKAEEFVEAGVLFFSHHFTGLPRTYGFQRHPDFGGDMLLWHTDAQRRKYAMYQGTTLGSHADGLRTDLAASQLMDSFNQLLAAEKPTHLGPATLPHQQPDLGALGRGAKAAINDYLRLEHPQLRWNRLFARLPDCRISPGGHEQVTAAVNLDRKPYGHFRVSFVSYIKGKRPDGRPHLGFDATKTRVSPADGPFLKDGHKLHKPRAIRLIQQLHQQGRRR